MTRMVTAVAIDATGQEGAALDERGVVRLLDLRGPTSFVDTPAGFARLKALSFVPGTGLVGLGIDKMDLTLWSLRSP